MYLLLSLSFFLFLALKSSSQDILAPSVNILTELQSLKERMKVMEEKILELQRENREQTEKLGALNVYVNSTHSRLEELLPNNRDERVAFSTFLLDTTGPNHIGPFTTITPLVYKYVFLNIGQAYSPTTEDRHVHIRVSSESCVGLNVDGHDLQISSDQDISSEQCGEFTAPLKGVYVFRVFSKVMGGPAKAVTAGLFKNGKHVFSTLALHSEGFSSSSNGVTLSLEKGDTLNVRLYPGTWIFDNGQHHHSSFSGHLLFPL